VSDVSGAFLTPAIFVMEIGFDERIPTYSGGLGVLAGDLAFSLAHLGVPATFVTLLSRGGYTLQSLDRTVGQVDAPQPWDYQELLSPVEKHTTVEIGGKPQKVGAWEFRIQRRNETRVLFLDTNFPENDGPFRDATDRLYGGDTHLRLLQDIILGVGGYRMLKALGREASVLHLNESHAAFATLEVLREEGGPEAARRRCAFTSHTPVAAGNDVFPVEMVKQALPDYAPVDWNQESVDGSIVLSRLAAKYSGVTNAVSLKHKYVTERILGRSNIEYVTNGVYHLRWVHEDLKRLFDEFTPGWGESPSLLMEAAQIPIERLAEAHQSAKEKLLSEVNARAGAKMNVSSLTLCVAKRVTGYKRNGMILSDLDRLIRIASDKGELQIIITGKTHPRDGVAKAILADIVQRAETINQKSQKVRVVVLGNYDIDLAKLLVAGSDLWVNNPRRPLEACGTSGMKAGMNGVLNFSVHDGWWLEGGIEGVNGWGIGRRPDWTDLSDSDDGEDSKDFYDKLEERIVPLFYGNKPKWLDMARTSIATIGPLFNSYRMATEYVTKVYSRVAAAG
jgi:starch phosphorylase